MILLEYILKAEYLSPFILDILKRTFELEKNSIEIKEIPHFSICVNWEKSN